MKDFQKKVTLEIDEHGFGVFISAFRTTPPQCLFRGTDVNETRQIFGGTQSFNSENKVA